MPKLIAAIIRHAEYHQRPDTPSAHQPFPLTAEGILQAQQAASTIHTTLEKNRWALAPQVDCSQLLRAWQTAKIVMDELNIQFNASPTLHGFDALAERSVGSAANLTLTEIEDVIVADPRFTPLPKNWKSDSHFKLPLQGAESLLEAGKRVADHIQSQMENLAAEAKSDTVKLFVGHGAAFRHAAYHLGVLALDDIAKLSMYHAQPVYLEYCPQKGWSHLDGDWKIRNKHVDPLD